LAPLIYSHATPYGPFRLDMNERLAIDTPPVSGMRVFVVSLSLLEQNHCIVEAITTKASSAKSEMQIAKPAGDEGRARQVDGLFKMLGRDSVVLLLPLQVAEATKYIDSLASSPAVPGQPQRIKKRFPGKLEMASISKKVSILAQASRQNVMILWLLGVPRCTL